MKNKLGLEKTVSYLGKMNLTRGLRNNNPGNLKYVASNKWLGKVAYPQNTDGTFEQFIQFRYGVRALLVLLKSYIEVKKLNNINLIISQFAPPTENNTQAYINTLSKKLGVSPTTELKATVPTLKELARYIAKVETGRELTDTELEHGAEIM
jgi:hypothetical protein